MTLSRGRPIEGHGCGVRVVSSSGDDTSAAARPLKAGLRILCGMETAMEGVPASMKPVGDYYEETGSKQLLRARLKGRGGRLTFT
jgi:hypothetical protein